MKILFKYLLIFILFLQFNSRNFNRITPSKQLQTPVKPAWLSDHSVSAETKGEPNISIWKPIAVTAAAAGITYALYSVRSSS